MTFRAIRLEKTDAAPNVTFVDLEVDDLMAGDVVVRIDYSTINYKDDIMGSSFVINNPNAETTCGCGSSFSV